MPNRKAKDRKRARIKENQRLKREGRTAKQVKKWRAKNPDKGNKFNKYR